MKFGAISQLKRQTTVWFAWPIEFILNRELLVQLPLPVGVGDNGDVLLLPLSFNPTFQFQNHVLSIYQKFIVSSLPINQSAFTPISKIIIYNKQEKYDATVGLNIFPWVWKDFRNL